MRIIVAYRATPGRESWATGAILSRCLRQLGHEVHDHARVYQTTRWVDRVPDGMRADLLIYCECNDSDEQYAELRGVADRAVYWEFDTAMHEAWSRAWVRFMGFGQVFCANAPYAKLNSWTYLPYAADTARFYPQETHSGVAIIGSPFGPRVEFARAAGIPIISGVYAEEYAAALRGLAVHVHYLASGGKGMVVCRPWETAASGVCLLAEDDDALRLHFTPGVDCEVFSGAEECSDTAMELLEDHGRRNRIAHAGLELIRSRHTYMHRAQRLVAM